MRLQLGLSILINGWVFHNTIIWKLVKLLSAENGGSDSELGMGFYLRKHGFTIIMIYKVGKKCNTFYTVYDILSTIVQVCKYMHWLRRSILDRSFFPPALLHIQDCNVGQYLEWLLTYIPSKPSTVFVRDINKYTPTPTLIYS